MKLSSLSSLVIFIGLCSAFDYHKYLNTEEDIVDLMDPIAELEKRERAYMQKEAISQEGAALTGACPQPATTERDPNLIRPEDCPMVNCTTVESESDIKGIDGGVYYRRVIQSLMMKLERRLPHDLGERSLSFNVLMTLDQTDVATLRRFLQSEQANYQDVTEILIIKKIRLADTADMEQIDFDEIFGINVSLVLKCVGVAVLIAVLVLILLQIRFGFGSLITLAVVLFLISIPWDWMQLYKKAVARRVSEVAMAVPEHCTPVSERTWSAALRHWALATWSFADDPCRAYHEALAVDPILDVSPIEAFTATSTKFLVNPLQYVGAALAKFFNEIGKGLPSHYAFGVILFLMIVFVLWLIMKMGYQIRMPFFVGLERAPQGPALETRAHREDRRYIEDVARDRMRQPLFRPERLPAYLPLSSTGQNHHDESNASDDVVDYDESRLAPMGRAASAPSFAPTTPSREEPSTLVSITDISTNPSSYPDSLIVGTRSDIGLTDVDDSPTSSLDFPNQRPNIGQNGTGDSFEVIAPDEDDDYDLIDEQGDSGPDSSINIVPITSIGSIPSTAPVEVMEESGLMTDTTASCGNDSDTPA